MIDDRLPLLIEPEQLRQLLPNEDVLLVDLCKPETYAWGHIEGAVHLDYKALLSGIQPASGKLPELAQLAQTLSALGLTQDQSVVAYDDEGGGWACRLLWTLDAIEHRPEGSLLNGGIIAWANEGHPTTTEIPEVSRSDYAISATGAALATKDEIQSRLQDPSVALLDARTPEEYNGIKVRAAKGGHIPGAANLNWTDTMDQQRNYRFLPDPVLHAMLSQRNIDRNNEVIVYCQTHHRSAHSYFMLKHLGFGKVKGYAGSWSEWGNDPDTPVE
ncbi:MAG: sulfurtransferase [Arenicellales bacterium]|nr:sulfurtransferase [Arenicellales bacterium]